MSEAFATAAAVIVSVGVGGGIVFALSAWLGKVWANRLMMADRSKHEKELEHLRSDLRTRHATDIEQLKTELGLAKDKLLAAHYDKVALYRHAVDIVVPMVVKIEIELSAHAGRSTDSTEFAKHIQEFEMGRLRAYCYLAMFAPQSVMNGFDSVVDYLLAVIEGTATFDFSRVRELALAMLNEIRKDLRLDTSEIQYLGARQA